jgi:hypothetical protein
MMNVRLQYGVRLSTVTVCSVITRFIPIHQNISQIHNVNIVVDGVQRLWGEDMENIVSGVLKKKKWGKPCFFN